MGAIATIIYGYKNVIGRRALRNNAYTILLIFCLRLLSFAWEGVICLLMAAPVGIFFKYCGFLLGMLILKNLNRNVPLVSILLVLSVPLFMAFENKIAEKENIRSVTTSVEINATPETIWKNVIAFPQLDAHQIRHEGVNAIGFCTICPTNQEFNRTLKELGQRIPELRVPFSKQITRGRKITVEETMKWEKMMTHTARRSFCTNMYLMGIPVLTIMAISGHKTEKSFRAYIKATGEEHAQIMKNFWDKNDKKMTKIDKETESD